MRGPWVHGGVRRSAFRPVQWIVGAAVAVLVSGAAWPAAAGTNRWTAVGPFGAEVRAVAVSPVDPTLVVAGTTAAGVFLSDDQGASWSWRGPEGVAVNALAFHPTDPRIIAAATSTEGVLLTTDGGRSFRPSNAGLGSLDVRVVLIDPDDPLRGWVAGAAGVYRSSDGGAHWLAANTGLPAGLVTALVLDPAAPNTLYAGVAGGGVYKSTDGGASWAAANAGLANLDVVALALDPKASTTLFVATHGGLWVSADGAASWTLANAGLEGRLVRAAVFDPFLAGTALAATDGGLFRTVDGGGTWTAVGGAAASSSMYALVVDRALVPTFFAGGASGVLVSDNGGSTFAAANSGLSTRRVSGLAFDPAGTGTVLLGTVDGLLYRGPVSPPAWQEESGLPGSSPVFPVVASGTWYAGTGNGVYAKASPTGSWTPLGPAATVVTALAVADSTIHVGTASGVRSSSDGGATWGSVRLGGVAIRALAADPANSARAFAATSDGLYLTQDRGTTWVKQANGLPTADITALAIAPASPATVWLGTAGAGVFRSTDGGASWAAASGGLRGTQVLSLAVHPVDGSVLLAAVAGHGVFRSTDGGASWLAVNETLPIPDVWSVAVLPAGNWLGGTSLGAFAFTPAAPTGNQRALVLDTGGWPWTGRPIGANPGQRLVWCNRFSPAAEDFPLYITKISVLFPAGVPVGRPVDLVVMRDVATGPVYTRHVTVAQADGATWNEYQLPQPLLLLEAGDVFVGVVDRGEVEGEFFVGLADVNAPTASRAWAGQYATDPGSPLAWPPSTVWGTLDSLQVYAFAVRAAALRASAPTITSISPDGGLTTGGTQVVIRGSGFLNGATVTFGGVGATGVTVLNGATVTAITPPHAAGRVDVRLANPDGQAATLPDAFVYFTAPSLALSPASQTVPMGGKGQLTVALGGPAPVDLTVSLSSAAPWVATVPGFVTIAAGQSAAQVQVNGIAPGGPVTVTASLPAEAGGAQASAQVTVLAQFVVPSVAHNSGMAGSRWYTDLAVVNRAAVPASLTLVYTPRSGAATTKSHTLAAAGAVEWRNVLESLFGVAAGTESQGVVEISATQDIAVAARTYNRSSSGTFGQSYPALRVREAIGSGEVAYLPQLKKTAEFRTNVGIVNLGDVPCTGRVEFFGADGSRLGGKDLVAAPGRWEQQSDVFAAVGVGSVEVAYATVTVVTEGGPAWAYASVIDSRTNDPTTVPMLTRAELGPPIGTGAVYTIPSVAHNRGAAGSRWFTDVAVVNTAEGAVTLSLVYAPRGGGEPVRRSVELGPRATREWSNILETLFGVATDAESQGVVTIESPVHLAISSRTYNRSTTGTFGQSYPALIDRQGLSAGVTALLPGLKKTSAFRTNVGAVNLGVGPCRVRIRLFGAGGTQVGETVVTVAAGQWEQVNDVFQTLLAGNQETAYATVEVESPAGLAWAYASVIDGATNDPTTIPIVHSRW